MNTNPSTRWQKFLKTRELATALPLGRKSTHSPELLEARIAPAFGAVVELGALTGTDGFKLSGGAVNDESGNSVSGAGDINGDGIDDLIIGANGADPNGSNAGASYVVFGSSSGFAANVQLSGLTGTNGFKISGVAAGDESGVSVSGAGDINGDGIDDIIIGAPTAAPNGSHSGASYVVFGSSSGFAANVQLSGLTGANGFKLSGVAASDGSGISVSGAGDINGDGIDDLIVGAPYAAPNGYDSGASYVVFGKSSGFAANVQLSGLTGSNGFKLSGVAADYESGTSVSGAGDINGDGINDLIVGARGADPNGFNSGASYVVFGQAALPAPTIAVGGKSATFTDVDGDLVTVKTTKGTLTPASFSGVKTGFAGGGQLQTLTLDAGFAGAAITITAKPTALGGNGFVNVGFIDATGVDLAAVTLAGDLGRIHAGTIGGDVTVPALKSLTVQSIGLLGTSTQISGGTLLSDIKGALGKLTVNGDLRGELSISNADGSLGAATIGGSITGSFSQDVGIFAVAGIGSVKVGGDIRAEGDTTIKTNGPLGTLSVGGSIVGKDSFPVRIEGFGQLVAPTKGVDLGIKSITVKGSVEYTTILAGGQGGNGGNADASIGSISVGGDWIASSAIAGIYSSAGDNALFTNDDTRASNPARDVASILASIGSFTVAGQAFGTAGVTTDMFGVLAEHIGKAKVGTRAYAFVKGTNEAFFAAPTLDGEGAENPMFDFILRELGSTTPTVALGGVNLAVNGNTATFTDVDGDLVTVKRTLGTFALTDFTITAAASGGGLLEKLTLTAAPSNPNSSIKPFNVTITAKPGANGGNGFVNVGEVVSNSDIGTFVVGGELQSLTVSNPDAEYPSVGSLTVHSLGTLGGTSPQGDEINSEHGIVKLTVKTDIRSTGIFSDTFGRLLDLTVGGSVSDSTIQTSAGIGTIKIGGSLRDDSRIQATHRIGSIAIGGDLIGSTIEAFAQTANAGRGPDLVLGKLTIGGNVEGNTIILGRNNNADASLGNLAVGREWLASSVRAGTAPGLDTFTGTSDDVKTIGVNDVATKFSTIASIVIKGQALGSLGSGDDFGIVAEVIGKAKIGARTFAFQSASKESFAAGPTGGTPGFDWFLREIAG